MSVVTSLLSADKQNAYRQHFLSHHGWNEAKAESFTSYFDSPLFHDHLKGLVDGSFSFSIPVKKTLNAKRFCYVYPLEENYLMGYVNFVLLQEVDSHLDDVYSRACTKGLRFIAHKHLSAAAIPGTCVLKGDIKDLTNTIRRDVLMEVQKTLLAHDPQGLQLVERLYQSGTYIDDGQERETPVHLFMGTPLDSYSNSTILNEVDELCRGRSLSYVRFCDDFALVLESREDAYQLLSEIKQVVEGLQLSLHPEKTMVVNPGQTYEFLGLRITDDKVTVAQSVLDGFWKPQVPVFRQLLRMVRRGQLDGTFAMTQIIQQERAMLDSEQFKLNVRAIFDCVNTDEDIRRVDRALVDWIRAVGAGTTSGAKYRISYEQICALGYQSLVGYFYGRRYK